MCTKVWSVGGDGVLVCLIHLARTGTLRCVDKGKAATAVTV